MTRPPEPRRGLEIITIRTMATILIVDEQAGNRLFVAMLMGYHGHRLLEAADGEEGLAIVRAERPDLVLTDILLPNMDGYQFVHHVREDTRVPQPHVVFWAAAYLEEEARALARACGVSHVVTKPADSDTLANVINAALAEPPPHPGQPAPGASHSGSHLRLMASKLYQRVAELEALNVRLDRRAAEYTNQLEVARSALQQEVTKRLWAEQELTQANVRLQDQAMRDALTGLLNRRYLEESLDREESRSRRSGQALGVMMIDIDHFKRCNDTFGHAAGDAVLREVSQYMLSLARSEDILCRYGGEEFVLVMGHASPAALQERAESLRLGVQTLEIESDGRRLGPVTLSVGIAIFPDHGNSGQAVLQAADVALYRANQNGRNCVVMGDSEKV
jgi:diguanylate cyclase (GGDEF)-like protein